MPTMHDHSTQRCHQLTQPVLPRRRVSRANLSSVNNSTDHRAPLSVASARAAQRSPPATISNPPALPDMETNHRRAAATPPIGVRLRLTGPRTGVLVKM